MVLEIPEKGVSVYFILKIGLKMKEPQMKPARLEHARRCWQAWPLLSKDLAGDELRPELATLSHSSLHKLSGKSFLSEGLAP